MEKPNFKNLDELLQYLSKQDRRISDLEESNHLLLTKLDQRDLHKEVFSAVNKVVPRSSLFSDSFLQRAFAVWGHYFVAQLLIGLAISVVYVIIIVLLLGGLN